MEGKDAGDIFADVLKGVSKQLINMGMNSLFGGGAGGGFGLFGKLFGFSAGGYTGPGGVNQPAGVVHKGEVVWSQRDVARHGGPTTVDAMRRGVRGFASGGVVAMPRLPSIPAAANASGPSSLSISVTVDGASGDQHIVDLVHQGVAAGLKQYDGQLKPRVQGIMAQTRLSGPMGLRR
ncbi:MAG: hypothetical protein KIS86_15005, partial [Devosia sp.]|nr:hypothetical protein [Devosia sp.]